MLNKQYMHIVQNLKGQKSILQPLTQYCSIELSTIMEVFYFCAVQRSNY